MSPEKTFLNNLFGKIMTFDQGLIVASSNQISTNLDNKSMILHLESGNYYNLNSVGANIWSLIQQNYPMAWNGVRNKKSKV